MIALIAQAMLAAFMIVWLLFGVVGLIAISLGHNKPPWGPGYQRYYSG